MLSEAVVLSECSIFDLSGGQGQSETGRVITHCDCILLDRGAGKFAGSGCSHSPRLPAKHGGTCISYPHASEPAYCSMYGMCMRIRYLTTGPS